MPCRNGSTPAAGERLVRQVYPSVQNCDAQAKTSPTNVSRRAFAPARARESMCAIARGRAGPVLLAEIAFGKFCDLPRRQSVHYPRFSTILDQRRPQAADRCHRSMSTTPVPVWLKAKRRRVDCGPRSATIAPSAVPIRRRRVYSPDRGGVRSSRVRRMPLASLADRRLRRGADAIFDGTIIIDRS